MTLPQNKKIRLSTELLGQFLEEKYHKFNTKEFIFGDPISIPHNYKSTQDIEIAGLLSATIAWGNRKTIVNNGFRLMEKMDNSPYQFVKNATKKELKNLDGFVHRTFNAGDAKEFILALRELYKKEKSLEYFFNVEGNSLEKISHFRKQFTKHFSNTHSLKHVSNPINGSSAKRLCMYLRWMVRQDKSRVDFGIWKKINSTDLVIPLDVHTGNVSRELGLLKRKQNDAKSAIELTNVLKMFDANDPVKYDFSLFGLGVNKSLHKM